MTALGWRRDATLQLLRRYARSESYPNHEFGADVAGSGSRASATKSTRVGFTPERVLNGTRQQGPHGGMSTVGTHGAEKLVGPFAI